jgi:hypothetical protein
MGLVVLRNSAGGPGRQGLIWHLRIINNNLITSARKIWQYK